MLVRPLGGASAILPPRYAFIPAGDDSPFLGASRRVARKLLRRWDAPLLALLAASLLKSCERRKRRAGDQPEIRGLVLRGIRRRRGAGSGRMRADQRLYRGWRAFRVRRADRRPSATLSRRSMNRQLRAPAPLDSDRRRSVRRRPHFDADAFRTTSRAEGAPPRVGAD